MQRILRVALAPLPLFVMQPLLSHIAVSVGGRYPGLFERLDDNANKRLLIDPIDMPFVLVLQPRRERPMLTLFRRNREIAHDALISGSLLTLLQIIDCQMDSDALFFNRDLSVEGDTEAVVALHNALDDMDGTLAEAVASCFGPFSSLVAVSIGKLAGAGGRLR